jgi:hypothetical protein
VVRFCQTAEQGQNSLGWAYMLVSFPEDCRWNADRDAVEFGRAWCAYRARFSAAFSMAATPERCLETYHLQRTRFERIAELKLRHRQLTDDGNVEITDRDLRNSAG